MTLEQYEKAQAEKRKALLASVNASTAAARAVDTAAFSKMKLTAKVDAEDELSQYELKSSKDAKAKAEAAAPKEAKAKEAKEVIATGFRVQSEESARNNDRGDFGGRGAGRGAGRGGRGGDFGGRGRGRESSGRGGRFDGGRGGGGRGPAPTRAGGPAFSMEEAAFPSLGK
jgi:membrane protein involved in colicin uptake